MQTSKSELLQLAYHEGTYLYRVDKINDKIEGLNAEGCQCIGQQMFYEAMVYL